MKRLHTKGGGLCVWSNLYHLNFFNFLQQSTFLESLKSSFFISSINYQLLNEDPFKQIKGITIRIILPSILWTIISISVPIKGTNILFN